MEKKIKITFMFAVFLAVAFFLFSTTPVQSAEKGSYPRKNIRIILFTSAGSSVDFIVRGTAPYLEKYLGTRLLLENMPGADGTIAWNALYKADPDGYTFASIALPPLPAVEVLRGGVKWRAEEFTPVYAWAADNQILFVNSETYKTFDEFVKAAREETLTLGATGSGPSSSSLLAAALLAEQMKLKLRFVGFDGAGELLGALAGKHIHSGISMPQTAVGLVKGGKIRPLLSFAADADPVFPEIPTPKSLGYDIRPLPHIKALAGPPKLPKAQVAVIESAFKKTLEDPDYRKWAKDKNVFLISMSADQLKEEIRKECEILVKFDKYFQKMP